MARLTCSSGCKALTQYYVIAKQVDVSKAMEKKIKQILLYVKQLKKIIKQILPILLNAKQF